MTDKELRRLKRVDLLELLIAQTRENERLKAALDEARTQLAERELALEEAGSIAEAALQVNKIFQTAQAAADQYLASVQQLGAQRQRDWEAQEAAAKARADAYLQEVTERCRRMEEEAQPPVAAPAPIPAVQKLTAKNLPAKKGSKGKKKGKKKR